MSNSDLENSIIEFGQRCSNISRIYSQKRAIMNWLSDIQFTASATLHGGALVANYLWDGTQDKRTNYYACPDDETFRFMASIYIHSHYNMSFSKEFLGGITSGASWYPIYGGMQDWNYIHAGCFELTLEVSDNKWPAANETGVHRRIFSSDNGRPLPASITIKGINYMVKVGRDYDRLLHPGDKYKVVATMPGYKSKTTCIRLDEGLTTVDFVLDPEVTVKGNVHECNCGSNNRLDLVKFLSGGHWEVYFTEKLKNFGIRQKLQH
ncbi:Carboxypeptidase SOL1 [Quillaja saponaria]|uniref:Carboxypeptidase SOL1 n=1 Tax=Quillaja saponaria TaxID=32244 RepID=A0AAD7VFS4_QUISA|nr:Carboxypeptidase SOL1 [Quillaja saponaria]